MKSLIPNNQKIILFLLSSFFFISAYAQTVTTLAGSTRGFANGSGTAAAFNQPGGLAVDATGNVYVADTGNNCIRKISDAGVVTNLAGSTQGFADNTGGAAQFNGPSGVAIDAAGTIYVADANNNRIRKITAAGLVSTLAGSTLGYAEGTGTAAKFNCPKSVAVDAVGNVYVADYYNNRIRKITAAGVVSTLAGCNTAGFAEGTGTAAQFYNPIALALDANGNVFVADQQNFRIRKITATGVVSTFAGSGTAGIADGTGTAAQFYYPNGVAVDPAGNILVGDTGNNRIRKITADGAVSTFAGSIFGFADGTGTAARFNNPNGVAVDAAGIIFITDEGNDRIRKISATLATTNFQLENLISIYPNPASSIINIELKDITADKATIIDMNGRVMQSRAIINNKTAINISNLANGNYLMQITTNKGTVLKKILKQ